MKLPVGMLIYWAHRFSDEHATLSGMWYYKEIYVPFTLEEKKQSINDLKNKRCIVLNISGTFNQILDILMQGDNIQDDGILNLDQFNKLQDELINSKDKPIIFDDIYNVKGTSLSIDTSIEVDTDIEEIRANVKAGKPNHVFISEDWSFSKEINDFFEQF